MNSELLTHLDRLRARLRLRDGWLLAQRTLWLPALGALLLVLAGRLWPLDYARLWLAVPFGLWLLAVVGWSALRPLPAMRIARRVDRELELKERLSTSLAFHNRTLSPSKGTIVEDTHPTQSPSKSMGTFEPHLVERLHRDALTAAQAIRPREDFPLRWLRRPLQVAAIVALLAVLLVVIPNPMDAVIAERQAVEQAAREQAQQIETLQEQVEQSTELTPEEREAILRQLEELARQLRENTGDREKALAELAKAEEALKQRLQPDAAAREAALAALAARLQQMAQSQRSPQDLEGAGEDLEKLAEELAQMTPEEREALAKELSQMAARAGQAGESALAQALAEMAMAAEAGQQAEAQDAASRAAQAMRQAQRAQAGQKALQRALAQMQSSRAAVSRAGQQAANAPGQGQNPGQGPGQGQSQGQGQGQQPGTGAGSTANQLPPNQGGNVNINPPTGEKPGQAGSDLAQQVYVPQSVNGSTDNEIFIPGQDTGQGTTEERETENPLPGAPNPALVPYRQVLQGYRDAANQALDQSYIPSGLKDYVKAYFLGLGE